MIARLPFALLIPLALFPGAILAQALLCVPPEEPWVPVSDADFRGICRSGGVFMAEARVDIRDDRHDMGFEVVDLVDDPGSMRDITNSGKDDARLAAMDFIFTVCDDAAGETAPVWPGQPVSAHWAIPNPLVLEGSDMDRTLAFLEALRYARTRLDLFKALPVKALDKASLSARLDQIGQN